MYCKLFASLYQGTLRGKPHEILVFTNLLAHADSKGFVDKHWKAISEEVGLTIDEVKAACDRLEAPDPESRSPEAQGARLQRVDEHRAWGWLIVNYEKYRSIRDEEDRREQNRESQRRWREKHRPYQPEQQGQNAHNADCKGISQNKPIASASSDLFSEESKEGIEEEEECLDRYKRFCPPTEEEVAAYAAKIGYPEMSPAAFVNSYAQKGWMVGKHKMVSWRRAVCNWKTNGWGIVSGSPGNNGRSLEKLLAVIAPYKNIPPEQWESKEPEIQGQLRAAGYDDYGQCTVPRKSYEGCVTTIKEQWHERNPGK